jgi:hypothetical protein
MNCKLENDLWEWNNSKTSQIKIKLCSRFKFQLIEKCDQESIFGQDSTTLTNCKKWVRYETPITNKIRCEQICNSEISTYSFEDSPDDHGTCWLGDKTWSLASDLNLAATGFLKVAAMCGRHTSKPITSSMLQHWTKLMHSYNVWQLLRVGCTGHPWSSKQQRDELCRKPASCTEQCSGITKRHY